MVADVFSHISNFVIAAQNFEYKISAVMDKVMRY
jgi:hypothetical protein